MHRQQVADFENADGTLNRRLRELRQVAQAMKRSGMSPLQVCEAIVENRLVEPSTLRFFSGLPKEEKHYWIASLYAILIPKSRRRKLAAYFTPPYLASYVIDLIVQAGIRPGEHRILDPASGGAAFLVPLANHIAKSARQKRIRPAKALVQIESTLAGIEIEPDLARLSQALLRDLLQGETSAAGRRPHIPITCADALHLEVTNDGLYDAVVGNPPYGRIYRPSKRLLEAFSDVISNGYVNLYALFIETAIRRVRPGGVICLLVPLSFIGGPNFSALRKRIIETCYVMRLDLIDKRSDVFVDVLYDVGVLLLRKRGGRGRPVVPSSSLLLVDEPPRGLGRLELPDEPTERIWGLPDGMEHGDIFSKGLKTLEDYGYTAKTGYFVWNREQKRYRVGKKPKTGEVPLYWAHNVRPNAVCEPRDRRSGDAQEIGMVRISKNSSAIIHSDAIIVQRTSNRRQRQRLIAGVIRKASVPGHRGFVSENHTILIVPDPAKRQALPLSMLCRLLNTPTVDARFRRISGSVSVSTRALRSLPLPPAETVRLNFTKRQSDDDLGAQLAYQMSIRVGPCDG